MRDTTEDWRKVARRLRALVVLTAALWTAPSFGGAATAAPSFTCGSGNSAVERSICMDKELSRRDAALADLYSRLRKAANPDDRQLFLEQQRVWLAKVRSASCTSVECLRQGYLAREEQLLDQSAKLGIADPRGDLRPGQSAILTGLRALCTPDGMELDPVDVDTDETRGVEKEGLPLLRGVGSFESTHADCLLTDGTTIRVKSGLTSPRSESNWCGYSPSLRLSIWVNRRQAISSLEFTNYCEKPLVASLSIVRERLDYCVAKDASADELERSRFSAASGTCSSLSYTKATHDDVVEFPPIGALTLIPDQFTLTAVPSMKKPCQEMLLGQGDQSFRLSPPLGGTFPAWIEKKGKAIAPSSGNATLAMLGHWKEANFDLLNVGKATQIYMFDNEDGSAAGSAIAIGGDVVLGKNFDPQGKSPSEGIYAFPKASVLPFFYKSMTYVFVTPSDHYKPWLLTELSAGKVETLCRFQMGRDTF